jgi:predicted SprT family Zn-dependent metalloprotease
MADYLDLVVEEIVETLDRAGFHTLSMERFHVEVTDSFQRRLGECRIIQSPDELSDTEQFQIRIARRLFEDDCDTDWRDTVRHEVAHGYVFAEHEKGVKPHGEEWKAAARRAGADPTARYEGEDLIDANYVLACPNGCFQRGSLNRSKRIKYPWQYACPECETRLVSDDADGNPSTLDPGICNVATISWEHEADHDDSMTAQSGAYLLACPNGCIRWSYQQRSKRIKNPWLYTCPDCGTALVSCDGSDSPTAFEPGTCNVQTIPWTEPQIVHACPNDCFSVGYAQHSEETKHPEQYRCGECNTPTVSYPEDQRSKELTPGTNYVD